MASNRSCVGLRSTAAKFTDVRVLSGLDRDSNGVVERDEEEPTGKRVLGEIWQNGHKSRSKSWILHGLRIRRP